MPKDIEQEREESIARLWEFVHTDKDEKDVQLHVDLRAALDELGWVKLIERRVKESLVVKKAYLKTVQSDRDESQVSGSWDLAAVMFREECRVTDEIELLEGILSGE